MIIEKGTQEDIDEITCLYNDLNDYLRSHTNYPGWIKSVYPVKEVAEDGINEGTLYVCRDNHHISGTVILNHKPEPEYSKAKWNIDLDYKDVIVVHTLALHPRYLKCGIGKKLIEFAIEYSQQLGMKAIRLDVYEKNIPAITLYKKYGFEYVDSLDLGYSQYGLDKFELYQRNL